MSALHSALLKRNRAPREKWKNLCIKGNAVSERVNKAGERGTEKEGGTVAMMNASKKNTNRRRMGRRKKKRRKRNTNEYMHIWMCAYIHECRKSKSKCQDSSLVYTEAIC